jgi:hypothetical protein
VTYRTPRPRSTRTLSAIFGVLLALVATTSAQEGNPSAHGDASMIGESSHLYANARAGLAACDGELIGAGDDYKVRFDAHGFELTPAFGARAPRNFPLRWRTLEIARGEIVHTVEPVAPTSAELRVSYARGTIEERYDLAARSLEQSFVFHERPAGQGDLVVRGELATELAVSTHGAGLRFELPGVGHFDMGGVTGIDARGARAEGALRWRDGLVELALPQEFVERAALPFVLDPVLGGLVVLGVPQNLTDTDPAIAEVGSTGRYLAVWTRVFSASDYDIHGQRLDVFPSVPLALIGPRLLIEVSTAFEHEPRVVGLSGPDAYLVAYARNSLTQTRTTEIVARTVEAQTGNVSARATIASRSGVALRMPQLSLSSRFATALCCWQSSSPAALQATLVQVDPALAITLPGALHTFADTSQVSTPATRPRLSQSDGGVGRYAVVFERRFGGGANPDVRFQLLDADGAPLLPEYGSLDASAAIDEAPEVDGDGLTWVVAWQRALSTQDHEILALSMTYDPLAHAYRAGTGPVPVATGSPDQLEPTVSAAALSCVVGWREQSAPGSDIWSARVRAVDPFTCLRCERAAFEILPTPPFLGYGLQSAPRGASTAWASVGGTNPVLFVRELRRLPGNVDGDIGAQLYEAETGINARRGAACGSGGALRATCATLGNPAFRLRLREAHPNATAIFVLSPVELPLGCGSCTLRPDLAHAFSLATATDAHGRAELATAIPAEPLLLGVPVYAQGIVAAPSAPACALLGADFSSALEIRVQ